MVVHRRVGLVVALLVLVGPVFSAAAAAERTPDRSC
jgi:hypothetical protein